MRMLQGRVMIGCALLLISVHSGSTLRAADPNPAATRSYAVALGLQQKGYHAEAIRAWQKFIKSFPTDKRQDRAHHHLGTCQLQNKEYGAAAKTLTTVITKYPDFASLDASYFNLGLAHYQLGLSSRKDSELQKAVEALTTVAKRFPKSPHAPYALYYQGECLYATGKRPEALAAHQQLIKTYSKSDLLPDAYYAVGTIQEELGLHDQAAVTFQTFITRFPQDRQVHECRLRLAQALMAQKKYPQAQAIFKQLVGTAEFADRDFALLQQARCLYEQKEVAQAASLYESLPKQFPMSSHLGYARVAAGKCWYLLNKLPQAQTVLTAAVAQKTPETPEAGYWLGRTLIRLKQPAQAVSILDKVLAAHPESPLRPELQFVRLNALAEQPDQQKTTVALYANFAMLYMDHPLAARALYRASLTALQLEDLASAQRHAKTFLAEPKRASHSLAPEVIFIAGESHLRAAARDQASAARELPQASTYFTQLIQKHPTHSRALRARVQLGWALFLEGKHAEALQSLTKSLGQLKAPDLLAEAHFLMGRSQQALKQHDSAIVAFRKSLQISKSWKRADEVNLALADSLRVQKKTAEAIKELQAVLARHPKSAYLDRTLMALAEIHQQQEKLDQALTYYQKLVSTQPKSPLAPQALLGVGEIQVLKNQLPQAITSFTEFQKAHPTHRLLGRARYLRGLAYQRSKQHQLAIADLNSFLANKGKPAGAPAPSPAEQAEARYALGLCEVAMKQHAEAVQTFQQLLEGKPDHAHADRALYEMGLALVELKKEPEAVKVFQDLAKQHPKSELTPEAWFRVGQFHEKANQLAEASKAYSTGLSTAKESDLREKLHYKIGWVEYQQGRFKEAVPPLQALLKETPKGQLASDAAYLAGDCLYRQAQFKEALELFELTLKDPENKYRARALYRAGDCAGALGRWPESAGHYALLLKEAPRFEMVHEARYGLGWAHQKQGKLAEARKIYQQVVKETNTEAAAKSRFMLGECDFAEKKYRQAVDHFLEVALGYPYPDWQALAHFEAGRCWIELKENAKALKVLRTLVDKYPKHQRAKDARSLIANLEKKDEG